MARLRLRAEREERKEKQMTDQAPKDRDQRPDGYNQFLIALALGTMISAVALFFIEYFGVIDVVKNWP